MRSVGEMREDRDRYAWATVDLVSRGHWDAASEVAHRAVNLDTAIRMREEHPELSGSMDA
jgi:hypothetical protein